MTTPVVMPKLGYDIDTGVVAQWSKRVGDRVRRGEIVAEVETGKGVAEVEVEADGVLVQIVHQVGDEVRVGAPIAYVDESA